MSSRRAVEPSCGYVVTELGRSAMESSESCQCDEEVENTGVFQCPVCQEVRDLILGMFAARQRTWEKARWYA